jgi:cyclase
VVASGGAGNPQHMVDAILLAQADAVLAASIFHFGQYTIAQTKNLMAANGIPVRLA